jgi:hypothetical protein
MPSYFLSIVSAKCPDQSIDPVRLVVRARRRSHLEALQQRHQDLLGALEINALRGRDYPVRLVVLKPVFAEVMRREVMGLLHTNFKDEAAAVAGHTSDYVDCLHTTWMTMRKLQTKP